MNNLPSELHHSQVVGKMGYIVNLLEQIDPKNQFDIIRADFKEEAHWIKEVKDFQTIMNASATGQCPDFDTLSKKSLILQELNRLLLLTQPFVMKQELVESMYTEMKNHNNLWSSFYHSRLNELEQLANAVSNMSSPAKHFLEAAVTKLQLHLSVNGLIQKDDEAIKLFQFAASMRDMGYRGFETQLPVLKAFLNNQESDYSFNDVLTTEQQQLMIERILHKSIEMITSQTLQNELADLKTRGIVDKQLFSTVAAIAKNEEQLQAFTHVAVDGHKLDAMEVESLFAKTSKYSTQNAIQRTALLCDLALVGKATPALSGIINRVIDSFTDATRTELLTPEFLHQMISQVVNSKIQSINAIEANALNQVLNQLKTRLNNPDLINSNMNANQLNQFINQQAQTVLNAMTPRREKLDSIGFSVPTFKAIEAAINTLNPKDNSGMNEIVIEFYTAIQQAKETYFNDKDNKSTVRQLEHITAKDFNEFFKECCDAGKKAAQKLNGNRSGLTVIADTLKAIANWGVYLLSFGTTPQFFKAPRTAVDNVAEAVSNLKTTLSSTLDHIELNAETNVSRVANS
jgi:hypothetical protein